MEAMVEERLSVFDDEPDLNDWVEVMCGAAMAVLGIFHLIAVVQSEISVRPSGHL